MSKLYVPIGVPGCGKSTWSRTLLGDAIVYSTDEIRQWVYEREGLDPETYHAECNEEVFGTFHTATIGSLSMGYNVIADATNIERRARAKLYDIAKMTGAEVHLVIFTNVAAAVVRNRQRSGVARVGDDVMETMLQRYEDMLRDMVNEPLNQQCVASVTTISGMSTYDRLTKAE